MSEAPYSPAEPPADGDPTSQVPPAGGAPRYSASASVPVPPPIPPSAPAPGAFGQGSPYGPGAPQPGQSPGQPGQPPAQLGQPPANQPPTTGQARVAASASVPAPATPQSYGQPPQGYRTQAGTYGGGPQSSSQYGSPSATYGSAPTGTGYGQGGPSQPGPYGMGQGPGYGGPGSGQGPGTGQNQGMGQGSYGQPAYGQPAPQEPAGPGKGVPTGGWPYADKAEAAPRKSRKGLIIGLIVAAVLVVVAVGAYVGWRLTNQSSAFTVGACVKEDGGRGVVVDCSTSGAFRITSIEDSASACPDPNQPSLLLTGGVGGSRKYACLAPAG